MIITNKNSGKIISKNTKLATSFIDRLFGLLLSKNPRVMIFKTRFGIHTLLMSEPIDVIVLDHQMRVVKFKQDLKPNSLFFWNPKYYWLLELPSGTITESNISVGDQLKF